jgi:hypothetical protein
MAKKGLYNVSYEGWLIISANNEEQATEIANKMLSESGIINDGNSGEWNIADVEDEEYYA